MPGENYEHLLDSQQKKEAQEAVKKGNKYDTREAAISNTLGKFDSPRNALDYLANLGEQDMRKKTDLEAKRAGGASLNQTEQDELAKAEARLSANQSVGSEVMRRLNEAADNRRKGYQSKSFVDLQKDIVSLKTNVDSAKRELDQANADYPGDPDKIRPYQNAFNNAQSRFQEAEDIYKMRAPAEAADAAEAAADAEEVAKKSRIAEYKTLSVEKLFEKTNDLNNQWQELDKQSATLRRRVSRGTAQQEELDEVNRRKDFLAHRWKESSDVLKEKEEEQKKKLDEENENTARATLSSAEIQTRVTEAQTGVSNLATELTGKEGALATAIASGDAREIAKAQRERNETASKLSEARKTQKLEEDALKNALSRENKGVDAVPDINTFEFKSTDELEAMTPEQRTQYDESLLKRIDTSGMDFNDIDRRVKASLPISQGEHAFYGAQFADRLMRGEISQKDFPRIASSNPDFAHMISQRVLRSEQAKELASKYGTKWEKMVNWAMKDYRWLMILIAIIAAAAGPATTVVGAGKFMMR